jgi:hypothetical protein
LCNTSPHAANNLVLAQRGTVVINHDSQAENPRFDNVISQFDKLRTDMNAGFDNVISQFDMFRTNMDAGFEALHATLVRKLTQIGVITHLGMIAILAIDRWWL